MRSEKRALRADLGRRAEILAESLQELVEPALDNGSRDQLRHIVERFGNRERLAGVVVYDARGGVLAESSNLVSRFDPVRHSARSIEVARRGIRPIRKIGRQGRCTSTSCRCIEKERLAGFLAIYHDASYVEAQSLRIWRETLWHVIAQVLLIVLITVLIVQWTIIGPISRTAEWMRQVRVGKISSRPDLPKEDFLAPFPKKS